MAQKGGFWGSLWGYTPPRERFSLEELRYLHDTLIRNSVVTDSNRDVVVETLRSIAELMIWGDQHEPRFFDYFAENNVLQHFTQFLQKRSNRRGDVAVQARVPAGCRDLVLKQPRTCCCSEQVSTCLLYCCLAT